MLRKLFSGRNVGNDIARLKQMFPNAALKAGGTGRVRIRHASVDAFEKLVGDAVKKAAEVGVEVGATRQKAGLFRTPYLVKTFGPAQEALTLFDKLVKQAAKL